MTYGYLTVACADGMDSMQAQQILEDKLRNTGILIVKSVFNEEVVPEKNPFLPYTI